jgi:cytochrome c biogenesis protein CcmG/thiol:disulfide interchange protein DsbE
MKRKYFGGGFFLVIFFSLLGLFSYGLFWAEDPKKIPSNLIGKKAPPFSAVSFFHEEPTSLENFSDKPLVINFFASWCLPCRKEARELEQVWLQRKDQIYILGIAVNDSADAAKKFLIEQGVSYPAIKDDDLGNIALNYGVTGIPETFFISEKGIIMQKITGAVDQEKILSVLNDL